MDSTDATVNIDVTKIHKSESEMAKFLKRITRNEVEEQLNAMKQRRLSRMNILDDEDTNNSEEKTVQTILSFKSAAELVTNELRISRRKNFESKSTKLEDSKVLNTFETARKQKNINSSGNRSQHTENECVTEEQLPKVHSNGSIIKNDIKSNIKVKSEQRKTIYYKDNEVMVPLDINYAVSEDIPFSDSPKHSLQNHQIEKKESAINESLVVSVSNQKLVQNVSETSSFNSKLPLRPGQSRDNVILKKFQLNWENLKEISQTNSDIDFDELKDLKNSLEEATSLVTEYRQRLESLEWKIVLLMSGQRKLEHMKYQFEGLKPQIKYFRGLKRDSGYLQLSNKLSNIFLEIHKVPDSSILSGEKQDVLSDIDSSIKYLESRVKKNQSFLEYILNEQVLSIKNNHFDYQVTQ